MSLRPTSTWLLTAQLVGAVGVLLVLALLPPRDGPMLLLPLRPMAQSRLVAAALAGHARILGRGPATSLVVFGARPDMLALLIDRRILALAAPAALCGRALERRA